MTASLSPRTWTLCAALFLYVISIAQDLPSEMFFSPDGRMLHTGGQPSTGLYEKGTIRTIDLYFGQPDHWALLTQNYQPGIDLPATMIVDGITYDSVGVRFKGQTSYMQLPPGAQKRSFNITMDLVHPDQDLMGYGTLNLNNAFQDPSFLREVIYLDLIRDHIPAAKANFVHLNINGEDWGVYPNIQQLNSQYLKEWFFSNNGSLWRADNDTATGGGPGSGPNWGDGTAALNHLGSDTATYQQYYTLKRSEQIDPWQDLVTTCHRLNTLPAAMLEDSLPLYLDIDRVLWFLATEIAFSDDDSYVHKGKMDYYLHWDEETGRMTPLEFDGNSVMKNNAVNWSPFYHSTDVNYPLLNKLLNVPAWRQRYLAHMRTIISEKMQSSTFDALLQSWSSLIDAEVQSDPKKLYSYNAFQNELGVLQDFITDRRNVLLSDAEVAHPAPVITSTVRSVQGEEWLQPTAAQGTDIRCTVNSQDGILEVVLYYSIGLYGNFSRLPMYDDGLHNDGAAGDGIHGTSLPPAPAWTYVRWYIEAVSADAAKSVSYDPPGAEHDIYIYQVQHDMMADTPVRINELMALNMNTVTDVAMQYDDWIELYNVSDQVYDLSGHWLTDNGSDLQKYQFPAGTLLPAGGYLIVWADGEPGQGDDHAPFGLSGDGEEILLSTDQGLVLDLVTFGAQPADMGFAHVPNGTGPFVLQTPTFQASNEVDLEMNGTADRTPLLVFPNPCNDLLHFATASPQAIAILDHTGRTVWSGTIDGRAPMDMGRFAAGTYFIKHPQGTEKLVVLH